MITKIYGIRGTVEASYLFRSGKASLRANFKDGILDPGRERPATLVTSNPVAQLIIEHQPLFANGDIFIVSTSVSEAKLTAGSNEAKKKTSSSAPVSDREAANSVTVEENGVKTFDKVKSVGQAVNVLMNLGATADKLTTPTDVITTAADMNVSFPNLKLK